MKKNVLKESLKILAIGMLCSLSACSFYSSDNKQVYADAEGRIPDRLLDNMGTASLGKNWVMAQLGPPTQVDSINSTTSVATWALTRSEQRHTRILLLYNSSKTLDQREYLHVVFAGDEVLKHWLDKDLQIDRQAVLTRREAAKLIAQTEPPAAVAEPSLIMPRVATVIRTPEPAPPAVRKPMADTPKVMKSTPPVRKVAKAGAKKRDDDFRD